MSTAAVKKPAARASRAAIPLNEYIALRCNESGKTNQEIAEALGYPRGNVIAMIKTGTMKLPLNKVGPLARVLNIDPVHLLERVLVETSPETWEALSSVIGNKLVTDNEHKLVEFVRSRLHGFDANVVGYKEMTDAMEEPLKMIAKREKELASATALALKRRA